MSTTIDEEVRQRELHQRGILLLRELDALRRLYREPLSRIQAIEAELKMIDALQRKAHQ